MKHRLMRAVDLIGARRRPSTEEAAYLRLAKTGYSPSFVIDVGAYHGDWTRTIRRVFPNVPVLMVEAQQGKSDLLRECCEQFEGVNYRICALASESQRSVTFYEMETGSSLMPERSDVARKAVNLVSHTLDEVASEVSGSVLLKIDVQGAELEILRGGANTLQKCDFVQLEIAFLNYNEGAPSLLEVIQFMDEHDFVPYDVTNLTRPTGIELVQADFLFCKSTSALRPDYFRFGATESR